MTRPALLLAAILCLAGAARAQPEAAGAPDPAERVVDLSVLIAEIHPALTSTDLPEAYRQERPTLGPEFAHASTDPVERAEALLDIAGAWFERLEGLEPSRAIVGVVGPDRRLAIRLAAATTIHFAHRAVEAIDVALDELDARRDADDPGVITALTVARETTLGLRAAYAAACLVATTPSQPAAREAILERARDATRSARVVTLWDSVVQPANLALVAALGGDPTAAREWTEAARIAAGADERLLASSRDLRATLIIANILLATNSQPPTAIRGALDALRDRPPFAADGLRRFRMALLLADAHERVSRRDPPADRGPSPYASLIHALDTDEPNIDARRAAVFARLDETASSEADPAARRPIVHAARAHRIERAGVRAEVILAEAELAASDIRWQDDPHLAELLFELGAALARRDQGGDALVASGHFVRLAPLAPDHDRAALAVALACATARRAVNDGGGADASAALLDALRLAHAFDQAVPQREALRLELIGVIAAEIASDDGGGGGGRELADEAEAIARSIDDREIAAAACSALARIRWMLLARVIRESAGTGLLTPRVVEAARALEAAGALLAGAAVRAPASAPTDAFLAEANLYAAEASLALGDPERALRRIERVPLDRLPEDQRDTFGPGVLDTRSRALASLGRGDDTLDTLLGLNALDAARAGVAADWIAFTAWSAIEPIQRSLFPLDEPSAEVRRAAAALAAVVAYRQAVSAPLDPRTARAAALGALATGAFDDAARLLEPLRAAGAVDPAVDLPLGQALALAGRDEEAFAVLRDLATSLESDGGSSRDYLTAWTIMLEILTRQNEAGERSETIRREIRRLRSTPVFLESHDLADRLRRVESALPILGASEGR